MIQPESPSGVAGVLLPPHRAGLWDLPTVAALGAHTYWRRPELSGIQYCSQRPQRWHRFLGAILGALWGASTTWVGLVLLSPGRDVAVSFWLPGRWRRPAARLLGFVVVALAVLFSSAVVLSLLFGVDVVTVMAVMLVLLVPPTVAIARVERRAHRRSGPTRVPGMASITGLASHSAAAWAPSDFLGKELLPWAKDHKAPLYTPAASPAHVRLYRGMGFVPAPEYGPLALIRPAGITERPDSAS